MQVVTGAFGYTGRHIARRLLDKGARVKTLTGHPDRPGPFGDRVAVAPLDFDHPDVLAMSLDGADEGADVNAKNEREQTPLSLAEARQPLTGNFNDNDHKTTADLLRRLGARDEADQ